MDNPICRKVCNIYIYFLCALLSAVLRKKLTVNTYSLYMYVQGMWFQLNLNLKTLENISLASSQVNYKSHYLKSIAFGGLQMYSGYANAILAAIRKSLLWLKDSFHYAARPLSSLRLAAAVLYSSSLTHFRLECIAASLTLTINTHTYIHIYVNSTYSDDIFALLSNQPHAATFFSKYPTQSMQTRK